MSNEEDDVVIGDTLQDALPGRGMVEDLGYEEIPSGKQPLVQETGEHEFLQPNPEEDARLPTPESLAVTSTILSKILKQLHLKYCHSFHLKS